MSSSTANEAAWRPLVAALADDETRRVFARLVLGADLPTALAELPTKKAARVRQALVRAALVDEGSGGEASVERADVVSRNVFAELLAQNAVPPRTGVDRFMKDGRLDRYPVDHAERAALLRHIGERALWPDDELTEAQLNERLKVFTRDFVTLRRYLVDVEILERTRSGSSYALAPRVESDGASRRRVRP